MSLWNVLLDNQTNSEQILIVMSATKVKLVMVVYL